MSSQPTKSSTARELKTQATILSGSVGVFWITEILDQLVWDGGLDKLGILPRHLIGLRGILFAPFLHGNFAHLIANSLPFLVLGWFVMLQETSDFFIVTALSMLLGGLGVWLFGAPGFHIGASGVIFGYLGFLLFRGLFQRNIPSIFLSVVVGFLYGGLILGVLPLQEGISWEGHLFGFFGGVVAAYLVAREKRYFGQ